MLWIILCLIAASSIVGALVINKRLLDTIEERKITVLYFAITTLLLTPLIPFVISESDYSVFSPTMISLIITVGILNVLAIYVYMKAIKGGNLSIVIPLRNTTPFFVVVLAALLISEGITSNVVAATVMIVVGAALLSYSKKHEKISGDIKSPLYALLVAVIAAVVFVIVKYSVSIISPIMFAYLTSMASTIILLMSLIFNRRLGELIEIVKAKAGQVFIMGLLVSIGTLATIYAISLEKASIVSAFLRVELLFGIIAGYIFFKETFTKIKLAGALLILAGLLLVIL